ncbi:MAG: V-type ATP synthase subunit D [Methanolinea sp.]|nr:V-type ATP synthase subunit D [Methanolinea sp.]
MTAQGRSGIRPTRIELLRLRKQETLAQRGHDLLEEKLDAMVVAFLGYRQAYLEQKYRVREAYRSARAALDRAEMVAGTVTVDEVAQSSPPLPEIPLGTRLVMGVRVPSLPAGPLPVHQQGYGLLGTSSTIDTASRKFEELTREIIVLAEREGTARRLSQEIQRTRRRVNALERILIPRLQATRKYIEMHLEEREREDQFRRKRIKHIKAENP